MNRALIMTAKLNDIDPQAGLLMCSPASTITRSMIWPRCYPGMGESRCQAASKRRDRCRHSKPPTAKRLVGAFCTRSSIVKSLVGSVAAIGLFKREQPRAQFVGPRRPLECGALPRERFRSQSLSRCRAAARVTAGLRYSQPHGPSRPAVTYLGSAADSARETN
jgi:hypothetical protein